MNTTLSRVQSLLKKNKASRDNDKRVIFCLWREELKKRGKKLGISFDDFNKLTSVETILRARRVIQNDEQKLVPTNPHILYQRTFRKNWKTSNWNHIGDEP